MTAQLEFMLHYHVVTLADSTRARDFVLRSRVDSPFAVGRGNSVSLR